MKKLIPVGVLLLFFTVSCQQSAPKKDQQFDKLVKQLNDHTHPLESPVPTSSLADLAPLSEAGDSKIVAPLASSDLKYQTMYQLVRNLQQVHQNLYARQKRNDRSLRDKYMAENAIWASQLFGEKTKIAVWAHNGHISESQSLITPTTPFTPMGYHLDKKMGDDYKSIAFSFNKGTFTAIGRDIIRNKSTGLGLHTIESPPTKGSINHLFASVQDDNFIFNIHALEPNSALNNWLSKSHEFFEIGAVYADNPKFYYRPTILPKSYDFIIHLDSTSHSDSFLIPHHNSATQK